MVSHKLSACLALALCVLACSGLALANQAKPDLPFNQTALNDMQRWFFSNIDYQGTGAIMASPSTAHPNYFYDWVRDAGITMSIAPKLLNQADKAKLYDHYMKWVLNCQKQNPVNGIDIRGEPKFYMDGRLFDGPWGRPQNDGPALRAMSLMDYAEELINAGKIDYVIQNLWNHQPDQCCGIKYDIEYVAHNWQNPSFDVWEEVMGNHFFTMIIQRKSLLRAASLSKIVNDAAAGDFYLEQANKIGDYLQNFWDSKINSIRVTLNPQGGADKLNGLDTATLLGVLYGGVDDGVFYHTDDRVLATTYNLIKFFNTSSSSGFVINDYDSRQLNSAAGSTLLGRYPSDTYDGYDTNGLGNPWFLTTSGTAEIFFLNALDFANLASSQSSRTITRVAADFFGAVAATMQPTTPAEQDLVAQLIKFAQSSRLLTLAGLSREVFDTRATRKFDGFTVTADTIVISDPALLKFVGRSLVTVGDGFFRRIIRHMDTNHHMSEQINRNNGYQEGARDLTWSYGATFSAILSRNAAVDALYQ